MKSDLVGVKKQKIVIFALLFHHMFDHELLSTIGQSSFYYRHIARKLPDYGFCFLIKMI